MKVTKVENAKHGWRAKVEIRRRVLEALTPARTVVFDAFAGPGLMYDEVWKGAAEYVGCDETWHADDRCCYVADNRRVLRCLDLKPFTCFDLDAYGSPWEQAIIVATRRPLQPRERLGLVLTEGTSLKTRFGGLPGAMRSAAGFDRDVLSMSAGNFHDALINRALHGIVRRFGGRIARQWRAVGTSGAQVRYLGVVLEAA